MAAAGLTGALAAGRVWPAGVALLLAGPLLVAGLGGGSVITPNQALSLADVDLAGGSTAGGTLQTAQRIGNAIGAAVISAVFYAASRPPVRTGRRGSGTRTAWRSASRSSSPSARSRWPCAACATTARCDPGGQRRAAAHVLPAVPADPSPLRPATAAVAPRR